MRKKSNALSLAGALLSELRRAVLRVGVLLLVAMFLAGAGAGVLYSNANLEVMVGHVCRVEFPEFLIPSRT
jgi:hypothetical protein